MKNIKSFRTFERMGAAVAPMSHTMRDTKKMSEMLEEIYPQVENLLNKDMMDKNPTLMKLMNNLPDEQGFVDELEMELRNVPMMESNILKSFDNLIKNTVDALPVEDDKKLLIYYGSIVSSVAGTFGLTYNLFATYVPNLIMRLGHYVGENTGTVFSVLVALAILKYMFTKKKPKAQSQGQAAQSQAQTPYTVRPEDFQRPNPFRRVR